VRKSSGSTARCSFRIWRYNEIVRIKRPSLTFVTSKKSTTKLFYQSSKQIVAAPGSLPNASPQPGGKSQLTIKDRNKKTTKRCAQVWNKNRSTTTRGKNGENNDETNERLSLPNHNCCESQNNKSTKTNPSIP
jgi:hypothetical protein